MTLAYLVSDYAAPSHTFVRREVAALRQLGIDVRPFSVQPCPPDSGAESLLGRSPTDYVAALLWALLSRPLRLFSTWKLALTHRVGGIRALIWSQFHLLEALVLARIMRRDGLLHLHNHFANSGATVGMLAAHAAGASWSLTLHGISETDHPAGALLQEKVSRASFVACASYFMRAQAMRMVGTDQWEKMQIVRCGIDLARLPARAAADRRAEAAPPRIICVGRLSPEKGYAGLLHALAGLAADGTEFSLTIVGDGPSADAIRADAIALQLADRVSFRGALSEDAALAEIAASDVFVLPSLMEGLPVVLIEAMALGLPVVASRVAGIPELVEDGVNGRLFTPSDWDALRRTIEAVLADQNAWTQFGAAGRKRVEEAFQSEMAGAAMASLFAKYRKAAN